MIYIYRTFSVSGCRSDICANLIPISVCLPLDIEGLGTKEAISILVHSLDIFLSILVLLGGRGVYIPIHSSSSGRERGIYSYPF